MWSKGRTAFEGEFGLNIDAFLEQDTFQQRVFVP